MLIGINIENNTIKINEKDISEKSFKESQPPAEPEA